LEFINMYQARMKAGKVCDVCKSHKLLKGDRTCYGGRVCHSCRSFFRRAVLADKHLSCKCDMEKKHPMGCRKCRYQRCLDIAGMNPELVKTQDNLTFKTPSFVILESPDNFVYIDNVAPDDCKELAIAFHKQVLKLHDKYFDFFTREPDEMAGFLLTVSGCGLSFSPCLHRAMTLMDQMSVVNFCFQLDALQSLSGWDKSVLIGEGSKAIQGIMQAWFLLPSILPK